MLKPMCGLVASVWLGLVLTASAQVSERGSIRGYVEDEQGAVLPGVVVRAVGASVGGEFSAVTDKSGYFRILEVPPGEFTLTAELDGFARYSQPGLLLRAGLNIGADIVMKVGGVQESVVVTGEIPAIETKTAVTGVNVSGTMQREVPLSARRYWSDFMQLVPGVASTELNNNSYYLHGTDFDTHVTQIDGADMNSAQQAALQYTSLSADAIEDVQVKTGAVDATAPLGTGAVINLVTRSGTNRFGASIGAALQPKSWASNNNPSGTSSAASVYQMDATVQGPVLRDRLWYFGSYRRTQSDTGISRTAQQVASLQALVPGWESFDNREEGNFYFLKLTSQLSPRHQLLGSYQHDPIRQDSLGATTAGRYVQRVLGGSGAMARLSSSWSGSLLTRIGVAYNDKAIEIETEPDVPQRTVHQTARLSSGRLTGNGAIAILDNGNSGLGTISPYSKTTLTADLTYFRQGWLGSHEVQAGVFLQRLNQELIRNYANGGFVVEEHVLRDPANPAAGTTGFHRQRWGMPTVTSNLSTTWDNAIYVQDAWRPVPRLTLNLGVRVDFVRRNDKIFDLQTQDSVEVGPRIGANYMLTADRMHSVRASWGRVHEQPWIGASSAGSVAAALTDEYDNDLNGTFETVFQTPASTSLNPARIFSPDKAQPYYDEATVGYRVQLPWQSTLDVGYLHRAFYGEAQREVNAVFENNVFKGYRNEAQNEIFVLTPNVWNWMVYNALELQVAKRSGWLQALASYTRQFFHNDGTWQPNDISSILQPAAFPNDRGTGGQQWRDHIARMGVTALLPWRARVSTNYTYQSGYWSGPIQDRLAAADPQYGPSTVTLSNGRVVSNPLATTLRFQGPTRGDGQFTLPAVQTWSITAATSVPLSGRRKIEIGTTVFNVANQGSPQQLESGAAQTFSPNFGKGRLIQTPRTAQVTLRFEF